MNAADNILYGYYTAHRSIRAPESFNLLDEFYIFLKRSPARLRAYPRDGFRHQKKH
jgi:hypothetical protein